MKRVLLTLLCLPMLASAADDGRLNYLEQEVRDLRRQVQALSRQIDEISTRPARPVARAASRPDAHPAADTDRWVDARKWNALRRGMSELEVIELLGRPTSMRAENGAHVLLYALEIGTSGYLGGSVTLRDRGVVEVRKPTLQ